MKNKAFKAKKTLKNSVKHLSDSVERKNTKKDTSFRNTNFSRTIEAFSDCV